MKCVVLHGKYETVNGKIRVSKPSLKIAEQPRPRIRRRQVLVRPHSVGICGSDFHASRMRADGTSVEFSGPLSVPVILGHEFCGQIVAVGADVQRPLVGQWVVGESLINCGECTACKCMKPAHCSYADLLGLTVNGTMAEFAAIDAVHCWPVDSVVDELSDCDMARDVMTLVEPVSCVANALLTPTVCLRPGSRVLVLGQGPIGVAAAIIAEQMTGRQTVVVDSSQYRCALVESLGCAIPLNHHVLPESIGDILESARRLVPSGLFDVIVEAAGVPGQCLRPLLESLDGGGTICYLARAGENLLIPADVLVTRSIKVVGCRGPNGESMGLAINIIQSSYARFRSLVTRRVGYSEICQALGESDYLSEGKIVFRPGNGF